MPPEDEFQKLPSADDPLLGNSISGLLGCALGTPMANSQDIPDNWEPPTPAHIAVLLPQYQIEHFIGRGGMGAVYKGRQITLNRPVAIKILPVELSRNTEFVGRFHREAQLLASLSHQGIVTIFDFGQTTEGHLYFVMEYVDGTDLHRLIHKTKLDPSQALRLTMQICEAMQYAHDMGVIHRDIKPANVLVTRDGRAKLADFGLALKPTDHASEVPEPPQPADFDPRDPMGITALRFTKPGTAMGTPDYAAPEVYDGKADARSDIYALGIMLYEMLTGAPPKGYYPMPSTKSKVDVRIDRVVVKALEPDPAARYQKASDMKLAVEQASKPLPAKAPAPPKATPGKPPPARSQAGVPVGVPALAGQSKAPAARPPARAVSAPPQQKRRSSLSSTATFMIGVLLILGVAVAFDADREWVMTRSLLADFGIAFSEASSPVVEAPKDSIKSVTPEKETPPPAPLTNKPSPALADVPAPSPRTIKFTTVSLEAIANAPLDYLDKKPSGHVTYAGVPFELSATPRFFMTESYYTRGKPITATLSTSIQHPKSVALLMVGHAAYKPQVQGKQIGIIKFGFADGSVYEVPLKAGITIRGETWFYDDEKPTTPPGDEICKVINVISEPQNRGKPVKSFLDMLEVTLPISKTETVLSSIAITDTSKELMQSFDPGFGILAISVCGSSQTTNSERVTLDIALPPPSAPSADKDEAQFTDLLDKDHKEGWKYVGPGEVKEDNGIFSVWRPASRDAGMYWYARRTFSDFVLRLEFLTTESGVNSGVFLRLPPLRDGPQPLWYRESYEFEIKGDETGAIPWSKTKPDTSPPFKVNDWNEYEITVTGQDYSMKLNGVLINKFTGDRNSFGYIAIQSFADNINSFRFRNVRIKELASSAPAASTTSKLPTIGADLLDVPDVLGNKPLSLRESSTPAANDAVGKRLAEIETQFLAARDREAGKAVESDIAALAKSYLTNGLSNAIRDAQHREARAEVATLEKERDAFLATKVVRPADENVPHEAVRRLRKMYWDTRAKYEIERKNLPVPAALYQGYLSALKKALGEFSGADRERVLRRYLEITNLAGFTTWATDNMTPAWKRRCSDALRQDAIRSLGGAMEGEKAITRAFEFLQKKQNADGSWGDNDKAGNTALALLAYSGRCETPDSVFYGDTIIKGILYLIETSKKNPEGIFAADIGSPRAAVEHGMATCALGEIYMAARLGSKSLPGMREAFEKGISIIVSRQLPSGAWAGQDKGTGFRKDGDGGSPFVTAWQCQALKAASLTGLKIGGLPQSRDRADGYLLALQQADGSAGIPNGGPDSNPTAMTGAIIHSVEINSRDRNRKGIYKAERYGLSHFQQQPPTWNQADLQSWFFYTCLFHESGGYEWKEWNERMKTQLLGNRNTDGHWQRPSALIGGNECDSTALCVLMLESYYRGARRDDEKKSR